MEKKNTMLLTIIAIVTLLVAVIGAAYAYFVATNNGPQQQNVTVQSHTVPVTTYNVGSPISLVANMTNFTSGKGDLSATNTATAKHTSGSGGGSTTCYLAKLNISANSFTYASDSTTPEILLYVKKNDTVVYDNIDITNKTGDIYYPAAAQTVIQTNLQKQTINVTSASNSVTDTWTTTVTFKNLGTNQNYNAGKSLNATIVFDDTAC